MTVSMTTARDEYTGNGVTRAFTVTFEFNSASELKVYQAGTLKTLTTHYTVSGGSGSGGTVTFVTAPGDGELIVILDDPPVTQETDYVANDQFPAASHEAALDKLTRLVRRLKNRLDRAVALADGTTGITTTLSTPSAGRALIWNASADGLENGPTAGEIASAQGYATAAAASAASAAAAYDAFDDRYLGVFASDPTTDNDGNALATGALYFNSGNGVLRVYNAGGAWQDAVTADTVSVTTQLFSGDGADTTFTLSAAPASVSLLWVSVGGVDKRPTTDYTLSGTTLTFTTAPPLGTDNISVRWISQVSAAVPNDGSVSTAKLQDEAVTLAKMADMASGKVLGNVSGASAAPAEVDIAQTFPQVFPVTATVAANALTLGLNPTRLDFRSATITTGTTNTRHVAAAVSLVVPDTATLGTTNATAARLALLAIDNAGTVELAVVNLAGGTNLDETTLITTAAITTAADSASVIYSTTARTNVPFRVVGFIDITEATAGTWATAPTAVQGSGGGATELARVRVSANDTTPGYLNGKLVAGTNVTLTEGSDGANETLTIAASGGVAVDAGVRGVGSFVLAVNVSGGAIASGATVAGGSLRVADASSTTAGGAGTISNGGAWSGTCRNIGAVSIANNDVGMFQRIS